MTLRKDTFYINEILNGKISLYASLVEKYKDMVFTLSFNLLKQREEAEEVAQDVFLKAYSSLDKFRKKSKFSTWLYRITYNECVSRLRKRKVPEISKDEFENFEIMDSNTVAEASTREFMKKELAKALQTIPETDRTILLLHYYEAQSINEISEITDLSKSNVKVRLYRARKNLYKLLKPVFENEFVNE